MYVFINVCNGNKAKVFINKCMHTLQKYMGYTCTYIAGV